MMVCPICARPSWTAQLQDIEGAGIMALMSCHHLVAVHKITLSGVREVRDAAR